MAIAGDSQSLPIRGQAFLMAQRGLHVTLQNPALSPEQRLEVQTRLDQLLESRRRFLAGAAAPADGATPTGGPTGTAKPVQGQDLSNLSPAAASALVAPPPAPFLPSTVEIPVDGPVPADPSVHLPPSGQARLMRLRGARVRALTEGEN